MLDYSIIKRASNHTDSAILMFSGGKDSIACLDLAAKYFKNIIPVYLYFVRGLSFKEIHFKYYQKKYNVNIVQFPRCEDLSRHINSGAYQIKKIKIPSIRQYEMDLFLRRTLDESWIIYGYKRSDSLQRRGILNANCSDGEKKYTGGIDLRNQKIYPIANWTELDVFRYLKMKKLPLSAEYSSGFRDINALKGDALVWIYNNFRNDYFLIKKQYPFIEAELIRRLGVLNEKKTNE